MREIRVGLVGYGAAGRVFHAPLVGAVPGLRLTKVLERHTAKSRSQYPWVEVVCDPESLVADVDLVVVATPTASHAALARAALLAGRHVVVDKPLAATSAEAQELVDLARERGRLLTVFQNRRWDGDFMTVEEILRGGRLGRLVRLESHFDRFRNYPRPNAWRERAGPGSGLLWDIGSHLVDQALVLFGVPSAVTGDVRRERDGVEADDAFDVTLDYDTMTVALGAAMLRREPRPRFALHGTRGSFVKSGLDTQEEALRAGGTPVSPGWGEEPAERWGQLAVEAAGVDVRETVATLPGSYQSFYENVRDAVYGEAELTVAPEQARDAILVLELARLSADERRTVSTRDHFAA
jgi:scyllo-inositol 2-dehydrogenase (NADP+)